MFRDKIKSLHERDVERYLVEQVEAHGGLVRKLKWIGRRGAPDRFIVLGGKVILVEVKRPTEAPDLHQAREMKRLVDVGCECYWVKELAEVDVLIRKMTGDKK